MNEVQYSHGLLREKFMQRDQQAVDALNNKGWGFGPITLEDRLAFAEDRLTDLCGVVCKLLEELDKK
jgi:hypothetical protein